MPDRILHRTWSIRTISPFARPLLFGAGGDFAVTGGTSTAAAGIGASSALGNSASTASGAAAASVASASNGARANGSGKEGKVEALPCRRYPGLAELADELTDRLRACPDLVGAAAAAAASGGEASGSSGGVNDASVDVGGTYATLAWIVLDSSDDDCAFLEGGDNFGIGGDLNSGKSSSGRKRSRGSTARQREQRHLHIDVRVRDEPAAQILLCCCGGSAGGSSAIQSFSYLLVRGQMKAYRPILLYLESTFGCAVGTRPFTPSPSDVASSLADWMVLERHRHRRQRRGQRQRGVEDDTGSSGRGEERQNGKAGGGLDLDFELGEMAQPTHYEAPAPATGGISSAVSSKPLELILAVPSHLGTAGLERITLTVPPVSLARLCAAVERNRPPASAAASAAPRGEGAITPLMVTDSERDDESSSWWVAAGKRKGSPASASAGASTLVDGSASPPAGNEKSADADDLPILRALQCYLFEAFRIDARHLHVVRAATAHAVIGTDGRIKPMTVDALPSLLADISRMVRRCGGVTCRYHHTERVSAYF